jgi:hypothetical protein
MNIYSQFSDPRSKQYHILFYTVAAILNVTALALARMLVMDASCSSCAGSNTQP